MRCSLYRLSVCCLIFAVLSAVAEGRAEPPLALPPSRPASAGPQSPGPAPAFPCGPQRHVSTAAQLLASLHAEWPRPGIGLSPITVELIADVDLVVLSDRLTGPAYCTAHCIHKQRKVSCSGKGDPCRVPVRFRVNEPVSGVKVDGEAVAHEGIRLQVKAGARFRLRQRVLEFHPETPYYDPLITVEPTCEVACRAGERRCPATGQCISEQGDSYCLNCTGRGRAECACRTAEDALKPDHAICSFLSGDYFPTGQCKAGRCEAGR